MTVPSLPESPEGPVEVFPWQQEIMDRLAEFTKAGLVAKVVQHPRGGLMVIGVRPPEEENPDE